MLLTSQIKELGAILQKLIKTWIDPGQQKRWKTFGLMAMRMNFGLATSVVGSVQQTKRKRNLYSLKN
jgi:hypothetical protein